MYATVHLLMINEAKYIDACCISVSTYREYGNKEIEHVIMIDDSISEEGRKKLGKFFDKIYLIKLLKVKSDFNLRTEKLIIRYGKWVDYAINKWYILRLKDYKKVLFVDADTLAVNDYSKVFEINTPAWVMFHKGYLKIDRLKKIIGEIPTGSILTKKMMKEISLNDDLCKEIGKINIPVNGSIVLVTPNEEDFRGIKRMVKQKLNKYGFYKILSYVSFPDENILFEYYHCYIKKDINVLGPEYLTTLWEYQEGNLLFKNIKKPIILNFDSTDKPWLKKEKDLYPEERIWWDYRQKLKL